METDAVAEENVVQFMAITGCTEDSEARHYLEACGNDVSKALNLYFAQQSRSTAQSRTRECVNGGASTSRERGSTSGDREMADPDAVRAPIAPVRGPIVEQSFQQTYRSRNSRTGGVRDGIFNHFGSDFRAEAEEQYRAMQRRLLGQESPEEDVSDNSRDSVQERRRAEKERSLRDIFQPPYDIMFKSDWESARVEAEKNGSWLMVNIQDPSEFASQVLNRDVWSNSAVKELVKGNFLFWQVFHESPEGTRIGSYYKITSFPSVFLIDPRTGEMVRRIRVTDAVSLCDDLTSFLDKFPDFVTHDRVQFGYGPPQPVEASNQPIEAFNGVETNGNSSKRSARKRTAEIMELSDDDDPNQPGPSTKVKKSKPNVERDVEEIRALIENGHNLTTDDCEKWKKFVGEKTSDTVVLSIVLRMPNGERQTISLPDSTKLKALFFFISGLGYNANNHILVLSYPKREYTTVNSELTLREMKFSRRELIHVEKKYN
ncbi:hypothetical protein QR680_017194 [Steinernema hermaphroditum]|uniref:UBX domain-containing protein n=1 Tax=Steinernema hermaphroditum TaxID=289476 RepID=A0AA39HFN9_9BILA|nr:hypothetical protein QR680_017194 [Steinernema hermaphroditum]